MKPLLIAASLVFSPGIGIDASQASAPVREIRCDFMVQRGGRMQTVEAPELHVLTQTAPGGRLPDAPADATGIMCGRTSIVPAAFDDEVLKRGIPLFLAEVGSPGRLGVLEVSQGQFRFRMLEGTLDANENAALQARLSVYQSRSQR